MIIKLWIFYAMTNSLLWEGLFDISLQNIRWWREEIDQYYDVRKSHAPATDKLAPTGPLEVSTRSREKLMGLTTICQPSWVLTKSTSFSLLLDILVDRKAESEKSEGLSNFCDSALFVTQRLRDNSALTFTIHSFAEREQPLRRELDV